MYLFSHFWSVFITWITSLTFGKNYYFEKTIAAQKGDKAYTRIQILSIKSSSGCPLNDGIFTSRRVKHLYTICWTNVEDVGPTLFKCYTNVLSLLGFRSRRVKLTINSRRYLIWVRSTTLAKTSEIKRYGYVFDNLFIPEYFLFHLKHNCWHSCWLQMNDFSNDMIFLKMSNLIYNGTCILFIFLGKTISINVQIQQFPQLNVSYHIETLWMRSKI